MPFVLDASIVLCWAFADEARPLADVALSRLQTSEAHVPSLWWFEVRNTLIMGERRGQLSESSTASYLRNIAQLPIRVDHQPDEAALLSLARSHRLSVYDAAYLELAHREALPLATLDAALRKAAKNAGVSLLSAAA